VLRLAVPQSSQIGVVITTRKWQDTGPATRTPGWRAGGGSQIDVAIATRIWQGLRGGGGGGRSGGGGHVSGRPGRLFRLATTRAPNLGQIWS
jgi:hypothetical protein